MSQHSLSPKSNAWDHKPQEVVTHLTTFCIKGRNFDRGLRRKSKQYADSERYNKLRRRESEQSFCKSYGLSKRIRFGVSFDNNTTGVYKCEEGER